MRILLVEDDRSTSDYVVRGLREQGHVCELAETGTDGLTRATRDSFDVMVVDRMMPELDGLSLVRALRATGNSTPVLFLTAVGSVDDRVEGLEAGADDYLVKPFSFAELAARVQALGRRPPGTADVTKLQVADLELDLIKREARRGGVVLDLLPREFALLEVLMRNADRVVTRTMLLEQVWNFHFDPKTSVVETHISRLRAKVDKPFDTPLIHTVKQAGYSLHAPR